MEHFLTYTLLAIPALFCAFLILKHPYIGLVIIVAALPIVDLMPEVPFASSIFPIVGGLTIGAHLFAVIQKKDRSNNGSRKVLLLSVLFVSWLFISNSYTSIQPDAEGRNWLFTFLQLLILVWLASRLMDEPHKHYVLFTVYAIAAGISAVYAIYSGGIGETLNESIRSAGLAGGANTAARYFLVGLVILYFLQARQTNKINRFVLFIFMGLIILGTLVTVSRTGILLLVAAIGMLIVLEKGRNKPRALVLVLIAITIVWFFADNVLSISRSILPSIQNGSDTIGVRYWLWQAGIRMLEAHPIRGLGIGQYPQQLPFYGYDLLSVRYLNRGAHNMYVQVAAEAGFVGLLIFTSILFISVRIYWKSMVTGHESSALIAKTWLVAFVLLLIGGITKHDHYDKLLWLMIGVSASPIWRTTIEVKVNEKD